MDYPHHPTTRQMKRCETFLMVAYGQAHGLRADELQIRVRATGFHHCLANLYRARAGEWEPVLPYHVEGESVFEALVLLTFNVGATKVGVKTAGWNSYDPVVPLTPNTMPL